MKQKVLFEIKPGESARLNDTPRGSFEVTNHGKYPVTAYTIEPSIPGEAVDEEAQS